MTAVTSKFRNFLRRFRKDESAPTTIEWILLLVVALIAMIIIYTVVNWAADDAGKQKTAMETKRDTAVKAAEDAFK